MKVLCSNFFFSQSRTRSRSPSSQEQTENVTFSFSPHFLKIQYVFPFFFVVHFLSIEERTGTKTMTISTVNSNSINLVFVPLFRVGLVNPRFLSVVGVHLWDSIDKMISIECILSLQLQSLLCYTLRNHQSD